MENSDMNPDDYLLSRPYEVVEDQVTDEITEFRYDNFVSNYLDERDIFNNFQRLVVMLYFALTTLSTVGYGDYHPASNIEMMVASIIMLGGVAFFSYIMSTFLDIISSYDAKMGSLDRSDELNEWIVSLERFT